MERATKRKRDVGLAGRLKKGEPRGGGGRDRITHDLSPQGCRGGWLCAGAGAGVRGLYQQ